MNHLVHVSMGVWHNGLAFTGGRNIRGGAHSGLGEEAKQCIENIFVFSAHHNLAFRDLSSVVHP